MNKLVVIAILATSARVAVATPALPPHPLDPSQLERAYQDRRNEQHEASQAMGEHLEGAADTGIEWVTWGIETVESAQELLDAYHGLTSFDDSCIDMSAAGAPPVPSGCAENESACGQCYRDAYGELAHARIKLETLRCVYQSTKRFADKAIAFGDSASGIHALVGLEWQTQKKKIEESVDELNHSYDAKLAQFMTLLRQSLEHVGQCETEFMNEPDWYQRFGFIYFTFMTDRYKRAGG